MNRLLATPAVVRLLSLYGREPVRVQAELALGRLRKELSEGRYESMEDLDRALGKLPDQLESELARVIGTPVRRVLNATGILVHTNLGRSPLTREVAESLPPLLDAYCDLELDLDTGKRSDRNREAEGLLKSLTGAPAALVVNNNAAALVLVLATLAKGREVVVSRGELVEIGGSFRVPSILEAAGVELREVGSTNRTRLDDYEEAIGPKTGLLLKVFPSNYRITGFVEETPISALVDLARRREVQLLVDEGSGLLRPHDAPQLRGHTSLAELIELGCDAACGSGDKLLGGPQAGILVGSAATVRSCKTNPLYRALRPDRTTLAALAMVLRRHLTASSLPIERMWPGGEAHRERVERVAVGVGGKSGVADGFLGGGSAPQQGIPGEVVMLPADDVVLRKLRLGEPPVVAYQRDGRLVLDLRTVAPDDDEALIGAVNAARQ